MSSDQENDPTAGLRLSDRAKYRLRLAAAALRAKGHQLDGPRESFYDDVQRVLAALPAEDREHVKQMVDWTEAFDPNDELNPGKGRAARKSTR